MVTLHHSIAAASRYHALVRGYCKGKSSLEAMVGNIDDRMRMDTRLEVAEESLMSTEECQPPAPILRTCASTPTSIPAIIKESTESCKGAPPEAAAVLNRTPIGNFDVGVLWSHVAVLALSSSCLPPTATTCASAGLRHTVANFSRALSGFFLLAPASCTRRGPSLIEGL